MVLDDLEMGSSSGVQEEEVRARRASRRTWL